MRCENTALCGSPTSHSTPPRTLSSHTAHVTLPVAGAAQHLPLGRTNSSPRLSLSRTRHPSSYGGKYPPFPLVGGCTSPSDAPDTSHAGFRRRRLCAIRLCDVAKSLRLSTQSASDSTINLIISSCTALKPDTSASMDASDPPPGGYRRTGLCAHPA